MPFDTRILLNVPTRQVGIDSLERDFGALAFPLAPDPEDVTVRALMMPTVAILDMNVGRMEVVVGRGALREAYRNALCIVASGSMEYDNARGRVIAGPGEALLLGTDDTDERPATYAFTEGFRGLWVLADDKAAGAAANRGAGPSAPVLSPLGESFVAFLESLVSHADQTTRQQSPATIRMAEEITSYIFGVLTSTRRTGRAVDETHGEGDLRAQALAEIRNSAHDPETDPSSISRRVNVSLGHLHRVFEGHRLTVAEEIRAERTRLALAALHDVRLRGVDVESVARYAGFRSSRSLRRAVLDATGRTPAEIRRAAGRIEAE